MPISTVARRSLYLSRPLENAPDLIAWAKAQGFKTAQKPGDMHVTVAHSKTPVKWPSLQHDLLTINGGKRQVAALGDGGAVVLKFEAPQLASRWQDMIYQGASWDFPGYQPHVTLTWDGNGVDPGDVAPYGGPLNFGPEVAREIDENWTDNHMEKGREDQPRDDHGRWSSGGGGEGGGTAEEAVHDFRALQGGSMANVVRMAKEFGVPQETIDQAVADDDKGGLVHQVIRAGYGEKVYRAARSKIFGTTPSSMKKLAEAQVCKVDDGLGLVFGWAIVSKIGGEPYYDTQGDYIPEEAVLKAATEFMLDGGLAKEMHTGDFTGRIVYAWPLTTDIAKAMGLTTERTGLMIAMKPNEASVLEKFRDGTYTGFSIGGQRVTDEAVT